MRGLWPVRPLVLLLWLLLMRLLLSWMLIVLGHRWSVRLLVLPTIGVEIVSVLIGVLVRVLVRVCTLRLVLVWIRLGVWVSVLLLKLLVHVHGAKRLVIIVQPE